MLNEVSSLSLGSVGSVRRERGGLLVLNVVLNVVFQKGQYEGWEKPVLLVQEGPLPCHPCVWGCHCHPVGGYLPSGGDPVQGQRLGCIVLGACPPKPLYVK